jgi:hypothetical protein
MISAEQARYDLNAQPVDYVARLLLVNADQKVTQRLEQLSYATDEERHSLLAQLAAYLAAAHAIFPEESDKLYSFRKVELQPRGRNG